MKKSIENKKVSEMTVGQLFKIFMAEIEPLLDTRENLMIKAIPAVVEYAERKERIRPERVMAIIDNICLPHIPPTQN